MQNDETHCTGKLLRVKRLQTTSGGDEMAETKEMLNEKYPEDYDFLKKEKRELKKF